MGLELNFDGENILLIGSVLLFFSIIVSKAGYRFGVPVLLLFLGVGMLFGGDGFGIQFDNAGTVQFIGVVALSIILFSGGMGTKFADIKPILGQGIMLATFGVFLTTIITGFFIYWVTGLLGNVVSLSLLESFLLAAVMSSTDSAAVFSILRTKKQGLKYNLKPMLELESGSNDPMAYMLTILIIQMIQSGQTDVWESIMMFVIQMSVGAIMGFLLGRLALLALNRLNIENQSMYPILLLAFVFFIFSFTDLLKGNGYLAVYIAGLVIGNGKVSHKKSMITFFDGFSWLFQIVMFLALGLLVSPRQLVAITGLGLLVGIFMIIFSRPIATFLSLAPFRKMNFRSRIFVSWVGLRGAVPIIFATYPLIAGVENAQLIFNVVFFITILSLLTQGTSITLMARWLGLATPEEANINNFNVEFPEEIKSAMSEIDIVPHILESGNRLMDLTLPDNTLVVMIKRDSYFFVPKGTTKLRDGDKLLVITDNDDELRHTYDSLGITNYYIQKN